MTNYGGAATSSVATVTVTPDTAPPEIVSVGSLDGRSVGICFSEELDATTGAVLEIGNYQVNDGDGIVTSIIVRPDGKSVKLELANTLSGTLKEIRSTSPTMQGTRPYRAPMARSLDLRRRMWERRRWVAGITRATATL